MSNERIVNGVKTRLLHGKDYVEVAERVSAVYKTNREFEVVESAPFEVAGRWVWRVVVKLDEKQYIGNAEVKLDAPKNTPDGTNPFECAETSAMGRALAFAGYGTVDRIASFDEVARSQPNATVITPASGQVVESSAVQQIEAPAPTAKEIYNKGYQQLWNSTSEFFAIASSELGVPVGKNTQLTIAQKLQLLKLVEDSDAVEDETIEQEMAQAS